MCAWKISQKCYAWRKGERKNVNDGGIGNVKNGWDELSGALFAELKRLGDTSLSTDELKTEIDRAKAVSNVSQQILTGVSLAIETQKVIGEYDSAKNVKVPKFFLEERNL